MNCKQSNEKTIKNLKIADLSPENLQAIQDLEARLGDICLIAAEKVKEVYILEAKLGPNKWVSVDKVYPEIQGLKAVFFTEEDAKNSKGALKSLLNSNENFKRKKKPIRVRKLS